MTPLRTLKTGSPTQQKSSLRSHPGLTITLHTSLPPGLCYRAAIEELISNAEANMLARAAGVNRAFIVSM